MRTVPPSNLGPRIGPEEDRSGEHASPECGRQGEVRIKDLEQVILIPDRADRPLQIGDALREHQRPRETDAGDLRHRPMDSERVEAEQVHIDVTTEAHEHLERLEGEASPFADMGSNEEDAHQIPSRDSLTRECTIRFRTTGPFPPPARSSLCYDAASTSSKYRSVSAHMRADENRSWATAPAVRPRRRLSASSPRRRSIASARAFASPGGTNRAETPSPPSSTGPGTPAPP